MKNDINSTADIRQLVDLFYHKIKKDLLIGSFFNNRIKNWDLHLEKMYSFWQTILIDEFTYKGNPFPLHVGMPLHQNHFDQWLLLWNQTIDQNFKGQKAEEAKERGYKIAVLFQAKIEHFNRMP